MSGVDTITRIRSSDSTSVTGVALPRAHADTQDSAFAALFAFDHLTKAKLHTQTMGDSQQMFETEQQSEVNRLGRIKEEFASADAHQGALFQPNEPTTAKMLESNAARSNLVAQGGDGAFIKSPAAGPRPSEKMPQFRAPDVSFQGPEANVSQHGALQLAPPRPEISREKPLAGQPVGTGVSLSPTTAGASPASRIGEFLSRPSASESGRADASLNVPAGRIGAGQTPFSKARNDRPIHRDFANGSRGLREPGKSDFQRIIQSLRLHAGAKQSSARLRLQPPELGHLRVDIKILGDKLRIDVQAETDAARDLLSRRAEQLKSGLENHGIHLERLEVVVNTMRASGPIVVPEAARVLPENRDPDRTARNDQRQGTQRTEGENSLGRITGRGRSMSAADARIDVEG